MVTDRGQDFRVSADVALEPTGGTVLPLSARGGERKELGNGLETSESMAGRTSLLPGALKRYLNHSAPGIFHVSGLGDSDKGDNSPLRLPEL